MRIAIVARTYYPIAPPFTGGLEAFIHSLCCALAQHHEVTLYAHADSDVPCRLVSFTKQLPAGNAYTQTHENDEFLSIVAHIESEQYDVIHNNSLSALFLIWAARQSKPVITTLHTPPYSCLKAATRLSSASINCHFVAVSHALKREWQPYIQSSCDVIYNGIDLSLWNTTSTRKGSLVAFGRLVPNKGVDIAIAAAKKAGRRIQIAGAITDKDYFQHSIKPLLDSECEYVGHCDHTAIRQLLSDASGALFPVRWNEPFGLTTVETMSCGVPVIAFDRGAFSEIVCEKSGVITSGTNVVSLLSAIERSKFLSSKNIKARSQDFPIEKMVDRYEQCYEHMM